MALTANFIPVKDGAELAWVLYADSPHGPPKHEYEFMAQVLLEEIAVPTGVLLFGEMSRLYEYIANEVVPRFSPFFT
jgi:hypothetical protein